MPKRRHTTSLGHLVCFFSHSIFIILTISQIEHCSPTPISTAISMAMTEGGTRGITKGPRDIVQRLLGIQYIFFSSFYSYFFQIKHSPVSTTMGMMQSEVSQGSNNMSLCYLTIYFYCSKSIYCPVCFQTLNMIFMKFFCLTLLFATLSIHCLCLILLISNFAPSGCLYFHN